MMRSAGFEIGVVDMAAVVCVLHLTMVRTTMATMRSEKAAAISEPWQVTAENERSSVAP